MNSPQEEQGRLRFIPGMEYQLEGAIIDAVAD